MDIELIRTEKEILKANLVANLVFNIAEFKTKTGLDIKDISFEFIRTRILKDSTPTCNLVKVNVEIDLQI